MSITGALSNALSGLNVTSRGVETVSNNIANALTEGYARRELEISSRSLGSEGQGVRVVDINRMIDMALVGDRRIADAVTGDRQTRAAFFQDLGDQLGDTGSGSLLGRIAAFESTLLAASSRPESTARLQNVFDAADALAKGLNAASDAVQAARQDADADIATQVEQLNTTLVRVKELNARITEVRTTGRDSSALEDERQMLVDSLSSIVPIREVQRENGQIALFTTEGTALLDGYAAQFGFSAKPVVTAQMSLGSGTLSGLTLNGRPIAVTDGGGMLGQGSLTAAFAVRDVLAPAEQDRLDALARDLIRRIDAADPPPAGSAGLFTDGGAEFLATNEAGLAGRIALNASVDPTAGGRLTRLRDGANASAEGASGNATLLNALVSTLDAREAAASGPYAGKFSFSGLAAEAVSSVSTALIAADQETSFAAARSDELRVLELADGVDTDRELSQLLLLERSYAANAKVITACDKLITYLLEM